MKASNADATLPEPWGGSRGAASPSPPGLLSSPSASSASSAADTDKSCRLMLAAELHSFIGPKHF